MIFVGLNYALCISIPWVYCNMQVVCANLRTSKFACTTRELSDCFNLIPNMVMIGCRLSEDVYKYTTVLEQQPPVRAIQLSQKSRCR